MVRKFLLLLGTFVTVFGLACTTVEIHGCFMCPIAVFLYWFGKTPEEVVGFLPEYARLITVSGLLMVTLSLLSINKGISSVFPKVVLRRPKIAGVQRVRMYVHAAVYLLITLHITLSVMGISQFKSICPRSWCEMMTHGQFGTSSIFWVSMFVLVWVWGRGACGWLCVFAPVQEQSANILRACGFKPEKKKRLRIPLLPLIATAMLIKIVANIVRNRGAISFDAAAGYDVGTYWIFWGGVVTFIPLVVFATYHLGSRWFCKYLCPIGGFMSLYSRFSLLKVRIDKTRCNKCGACTAQCQMSVDINKHINESKNMISDPYCINCGDCISTCRKKALTFGLGIKRVKLKECEDSKDDLLEAA